MVLVYNVNITLVSVFYSATMQHTSWLSDWVQMCALPTPTYWRAIVDKTVDGYYLMASTNQDDRPSAGGTWVGGNQNRSEERRVGKECRSRVAACRGRDRWRTL